MSKYFVKMSLRVTACGKRFSSIQSSPEMRELMMKGLLESIINITIYLLHLLCYTPPLQDHLDLGLIGQACSKVG